MAIGKERSPQEREELVFPSAEDAAAWRERVAERLRSGERGSVRKRRELVAQEVAREFERLGEGVGTIIRPWEHTVEEHTEVQQLVDVAFARDLPAALRQARASAHYPRNVDLFHDVLTTEMYALVREYGLSRQPYRRWLIVTGGIAAAVAGVLLYAFTN